MLDDEHGSGHLVFVQGRGQAGAEVFGDGVVGGGWFGADVPGERHGGDDGVSEFGVGYADDRRVGDAVECGQRVFDGAGQEFEAAGDDDVVDAAEHREPGSPGRAGIAGGT